MTLKIRPEEKQAIARVMKEVDELFNPPPKPKTLSELADPKFGIIPNLPPIDFTDSEKARLNIEPVPESELRRMERGLAEARSEISKAKLRNLLHQQSICTHEFRYAGHSHNEDAYECRLCGLIEYR